MPSYQIPKRVTLEDIKSVLKGYYVEGAHNNPVSTGDVESTTQLSDRVGRQTPFLEEIGILEKKGQKRALTDVGAQIAEALMGGGDAMAKSQMRDVLMEWEFTTKIIGFVRMQGPVERNQLFEYIKANAAADDSRGKETLLELYLWTDILKETDEDVYGVSDAKPPSEKEVTDGKDETPLGDSESETSPDSYSEEQAHHPPGSSTHGFNIDFQFTAEDDADKVLKTIVAARRGLEEDLDKLLDELDDDDSEQ